MGQISQRQNILNSKTWIGTKETSEDRHWTPWNTPTPPRPRPSSTLCTALLKGLVACHYNPTPTATATFFLQPSVISVALKVLLGLIKKKKLSRRNLYLATVSDRVSVTMPTPTPAVKKQLPRSRPSTLIWRRRHGQMSTEQSLTNWPCQAQYLKLRTKRKAGCCTNDWGRGISKLRVGWNWSWS